MSTRKGQHYVHGGDVQLLQVDSIPTTAKEVPGEPLAYGEVSGHIHIVTGDAKLFKDDKGNFFVAVGEDGATLQHTMDKSFNGDYSFRGQFPKADHKPVELKPNTTYAAGIHKKFSPFENVWTKARD